MYQLPTNIEKISLKVIEKFSKKITNPWLLVDSCSQSLFVINNKALICEYIISTSKFGMGCEQDSFKTPLGAHKIAQKIGEESLQNEIFVGRIATGQIANVVHEKKSSKEDLILTRVLWLQGLELKKNCGEGIDSFKRYIYIHGTHEEGLLGTSASHGCVRMSNTDIVDLYQKVPVGTFVYIV